MDGSKFVRQWLVLVRLVFTVILLSGCGGGSPSGPTPNPPASPPPAPPPAPPPTPSGSFVAQLTDASGDATPDPRVTASPDFTGGRVDVNNGVARFRIDVVPNGVDFTRWVVRVLIDLDENVSTGVPGVFTSGVDPIGDASAIGVDAFITTNTLGDRVFVGFCATSSPSSCASGGNSYTMSVDGSGASFEIPLFALSFDDGRMAVKFVTNVIVSSRGGNILDVMPNVGLPPAVTR